MMPWTDIPPKPSDVLAVRACRGEYEPASFVAYPIEDDLTVEVSATDLKGPAGAIGSDRVDIRVVKCWYQAGSSEGYSLPPKYVEEVGEKDIMILENTPVDESRRVLTPELLLKDDDLVRTEKWYRLAAGKRGAEKEVRSANIFIENLDVKKADLNIVRNEMIGWILELNKTTVATK